MAGKDQSPEKKLLNIIEGQQEQIKKTQTIRATKRIISPDILKERFNFLKSKFSFKRGRKKKKSLSKFDVKQANILLQGALILLVITLGITITFGVSNLKKNTAIQIPNIEGIAQAEPVQVISLLQPEEYYISRVKARDIFKFGDIIKKNEVVFEEEEEPQVSRLSVLVENMKIVGISWGKEPDAVIEDTVTRKTYFVKKGAKIADVLVKDILKDKVVLSDGIEEVEIR